jgi:oligopeptide/dipeptide ABC transporter ATP-binding protein
MTPVIDVADLRKSFTTKRNAFGRTTRWVHAVKGVDLAVDRGETLAVVGESGSGKSTVGRLMLRLVEADQGVIRFDGDDVRGYSRRELRRYRAKARMIFQDPYASLDPRMVVADSVGEPLKVHRRLKSAERRKTVEDLFGRVGLKADQLDRYPYEFSGGQLQRIAVARAIATDPELIICDEPVAALDMSIRAQVINLLHSIQEERQIAYVFISHDLSLVRLIAHRIAVMFRGRVVETGETSAIFAEQRHPYTRALLSAIPLPDPDRDRSADAAVARAAAREEVVDLPGCDYADRCPEVMDICRSERPEPRLAGHVEVACHLYGRETGETATKQPVPVTIDTRPATADAGTDQ